MEPLSFEFVTVEEAKQVLDGVVPAGSELPDWTALRSPETEDMRMLSMGALRWLASLPVDVQPREMCRGYPRIGNHLAALAGSPAAQSGFVGDLLIDKRGGRQGFPGGIALELSRLQEYLLQSMQA